MDARLFVLRKRNVTSNRHRCPDTSIASIIASIDPLRTLRDRLAIMQNSGGAVPRSCPPVAAPRAGRAALNPAIGIVHRSAGKDSNYILTDFLVEDEFSIPRRSREKSIARLARRQ
jgi:hypothetical protein